MSCGQPARCAPFASRALLCIALAATPLFASAASQHYEIGAGELSAAIDAFAAQSRLQLLYMPALLQGRRSPGYIGDGSDSQALDALLRDTGVTFERVDANMVVLRDAAHASTRPAPADATPSASEMEPVLVSAQKRLELLQDVPLSVVSLDARKFADSGYSRLADYIAQVPGLTLLSGSPGDAQLALRGISGGPGYAPAVAVTLDEVPFGAASNDTALPDLDPLELARIEVLRGPQGTLYGSNSLGGLFKYVSRAPEPEHESGTVQLVGTTLAHGGDGYALRADRNIPLGHDAALRIGLSQRLDAGVVDDIDGRHDIDSAQHRSARLGWRWTPDARLDVRLDGFYQTLDQAASNVVDVSSDGQPLHGRWLHARQPGTDRYNIDNRLYALHIDADLNWATLSAISGYSEARWNAWQDVDYTAIAAAGRALSDNADIGTAVATRLRLHRYSQELRLASPDDSAPRQWLLGLFYSREYNSQEQRFIILDAAGRAAGYAPVLINTDSNRYQDTAVFANVDLQLTPRLDVQIGGRYSLHEMSGGGDASGLLYPDRVSNHSATHETVPTYQLNPRLRLSERWTAYARIATGYRAGGTNSPFIDAPPRYVADRLTSYEVGLKGHTDALALEASLFHIEWRNIQLRLTDEDSGSLYYDNAGRARSDGAEFSVDWSIAEGWRLHGSSAYTDATLAQDITGAGVYGRRGDKLPYSARMAGQLSLTRSYQRDAGRLYWQLGAQTVGRRLGEFADSAGGSRFVAPGYSSYRAELGYAHDAWRASAYINNLTDHDAWLMMRVRGDIETVIPLQPRTFGVTWTLDY